jgi:hypothetical protein
LAASAPVASRRVAKVEVEPGRRRAAAELNAGRGVVTFAASGSASAMSLRTAPGLSGSRIASRAVVQV